MRIVYAEDEDFAGQAALWEANLTRSLAGRRGQQSLRELEAALLALPEKRLVADALETDAGVCAIGALAKFKQYDGDMALPEVLDEYEEYKVQDAMLKVAKELGLPKLVATAVIAENDDSYPPNMTPERRYERVLSWVRSHTQSHEQVSSTANDG